MTQGIDIQQESVTSGRRIIFEHIVGILSVMFVLFQLYTAGFGQYPNMIQRAIHAGFSLILAFLVLPVIKHKKLAHGPSILNVLLALVSGGLCLYIVFNYNRLMEGIGVAARPYEIIMGVALVLLAMESARRATGILLPLMATLCMAYAYLGAYIPGYWGHSGFQLSYIIEYLYLGPEGVWGVLTGISATLVAAYIIFGSILLATGGAASFMQIALLFGGRSYGGAAKVATVASGLFGMLSGSAIANVATTGNFTIPMMKRLGYRNHFAGGVEATASSGGQITPPIMGAGAFIMSELIGEPYLKIAFAATLPALLFYLCVWVSIDLEARKVNLSRVPPEDIPSARSVFTWKTVGPVGVTIVVLLMSLFKGHTPTKAAFLAVMTNLFLYLFFNPLRKDAFIDRCRIVYKGIEESGKGMITVVSLLICAQITIAMISLSGMGIKLSEMVIGASSGHLAFALILAALVSLILGMGIPTTAAYVLAASVVGPALQMMDVTPLSAHMFIFYCAILSGLTPPVCTAVFTAASIAKADWIKVAVVSIRLAIMKYILPFFFVFRPSVLMMGKWSVIVQTVVVTIISANLMAIGTVGYYRGPINVYLRVFTVLTAVLLILPGVVYDAIGIFFFCGLVVWMRIKERRAALVAGAASPGC